MEDNRRSRLLEQNEEIALSLLMDDYANDEGKRLLQEFEDAQKNGALREIPHELDKKCKWLIEKSFSKQKRVLRLKQLGRSLARVAVLALIVLGLSTVTVLSVDAFRIPVLNFLMDQSGRYSALIFDTDSHVEEISTNHIVMQFESNIPEGYCVKKNTFNDTAGIIYCVNENEHVIYLEVAKVTREMNVDTEGVEYVELDFSNYTAAFQDKEGFHLRWVDERNQTVYILFADGLEIDVFWELAYTIVE